MWIEIWHSDRRIDDVFINDRSSGSSYQQRQIDTNDAMQWSVTVPFTSQTILNLHSLNNNNAVPTTEWRVSLPPISISDAFIISIATAQSHTAHTQHEENYTEIMIIIIMFGSICVTNHTYAFCNGSSVLWAAHIYFNVKTLPFVRSICHCARTLSQAKREN